MRYSAIEILRNSNVKIVCTWTGLRRSSNFEYLCQFSYLLLSTHEIIEVPRNLCTYFNYHFLLLLRQTQKKKYIYIYVKNVFVHGNLDIGRLDEFSETRAEDLIPRFKIPYPYKPRMGKSEFQIAKIRVCTFEMCTVRVCTFQAFIGTRPK